MKRGTIEPNCKIKEMKPEETISKTVRRKHYY